MKYIICTMILFYVGASKMIFDFNEKTDIKNWTIVNDDVMGGKSSSTFDLNAEGYGVFKGNISLENYGGFCSVRYNFKKKLTTDYSKVRITLKGDGKQYQLRIKSKSNDYHSYIKPFLTSGMWQEIEIQLKDMYPSYRGRKLKLQNYSHNYIEEIAFLIGNGKEEDFKIMIDKIELI